MESNSEKRTCYVKIIVNPQACKSFSLRFELYPKKDVNLKIMLPNPTDLETVIDEIKKQIPMKYNFNVQWNWKNVPQLIKDNKKFQEEILKIFHVGNINNKISNSNIEYIKYAELVKMHTDQHGAAPDFKNNFNDKNKIKIYNYIKTILGIPKLTMEQSNIIVELINK